MTELNSDIKFEKTTIEKLIESNPSIIIGDIVFHYLPKGIKTTKEEFQRYVKIFAKDEIQKDINAK